MPAGDFLFIFDYNPGMGKKWCEMLVIAEK